MLKLLFLVSVFCSLIRSRVFKFLFSMAEGRCEKFPDHWNVEFFWTVIVEYISRGCPVDILIKRWVVIILLFSFSSSFSNYIAFFFFFKYLDFSFSGFSCLTSPENWLWNLNCPPIQTLLIHVGVPPVTDLFLRPVILPVNL